MIRRGLPFITSKFMVSKALSAKTNKQICCTYFHFLRDLIILVVWHVDNLIKHMFKIKDKTRQHGTCSKWSLSVPHFLTCSTQIAVNLPSAGCWKFTQAQPRERRVIMSLHTLMERMGPAGLNFSYSMASVTSGCRSPTYREAIGQLGALGFMAGEACSQATSQLQVRYFEDNRQPKLAF